MPALPTVTAVRLTGARHRAELPLLVLGPPLGTAATVAWSDAAAAGLTDAYDVVAWDLPGQGHNRSVPEEPYSLAELAAGVLAVVDEVLLHRDESGGVFAYAGVGLGGAVGLQLLLDVPERVSGAVLVGTGAREADLTSRGGPVAFDLRDRLAEVTSSAVLVPGAQDVAEVVRLHLLGEAPTTDDRALLEELEGHLREALAGGLSVAEIEALLHRLGEPARGGGE